jgi:hypothetical protein
MTQTHSSLLGPEDGDEDFPLKYFSTLTDYAVLYPRRDSFKATAIRTSNPSKRNVPSTSDITN